MTGRWAVVSGWLLPTTDLVVALQFGLLVVLTGFGWQALASRRHWRPALLGTALLLLGALGIRAAH